MSEVKLPLKTHGESGSAILDADGCLIAHVDRLHKSMRWVRSRRNFIIAAANSHDDLLAACENLISVIEQLIPEPSARGVADVVLFQARAAVAKAKCETK